MITINLDGWELPSATLTGLEEAVATYADAGGIINARVVSAAEVRAANREHADTDEATDVLAFAYYPDSHDQHAAWEEMQLEDRPLGDILISQSHIRSQAAAAGVSEEAECVLLLTHGVLHVLGFDHQTQLQQQRMDELQRHILEQLGYPYRRFHWAATNSE